MARKVKCVYCGNEFDPTKESYQKVRTNRYAHSSCCVDDNVEWMKDKIKMYARSKLGESYNAAKVNAQIKNLMTKLFLTPQTIYQALEYWYDIQGASPEKANGGIGIVESVWAEAQQYYKNKQYRLEQSAKYNIKDFILPDAEPVVIKWEPPVRPKNYKIIDLK